MTSKRGKKNFYKGLLSPLPPSSRDTHTHTHTHTIQITSLITVCSMQVEELKAQDDTQGKVIVIKYWHDYYTDSVDLLYKADLLSSSTEYWKLWYRTWMDLRYCIHILHINSGNSSLSLSLSLPTAEALCLLQDSLRCSQAHHS